MEWIRQLVMQREDHEPMLHGSLMLNRRLRMALRASPSLWSQVHLLMHNVGVAKLNSCSSWDPCCFGSYRSASPWKCLIYSFTMHGLWWSNDFYVFAGIIMMSPWQHIVYSHLGFSNSGHAQERSTKDDSLKFCGFSEWQIQWGCFMAGLSRCSENIAMSIKNFISRGDTCMPYL